MIKEPRLIEIKTPDGWQPCHMDNLEKGDVIRLLENGKFVADKDGFTEFVVQDNVKIEVEPYQA